MADPLESIWPHDLGRNSERNASGCPYVDTTTLGFWPHGWSQEFNHSHRYSGDALITPASQTVGRNLPPERRKWGGGVESIICILGTHMRMHQTVVTLSRPLWAAASPATRGTRLNYGLSTAPQARPASLRVSCVSICPVCVVSRAATFALCVENCS